jgi:hypothetical protein
LTGTKVILFEVIIYPVISHEINPDILAETFVGGEYLTSGGSFVI